MNPALPSLPVLISITLMLSFLSTSLSFVRTLPFAFLPAVIPASSAPPPSAVAIGPSLEPVMVTVTVSVAVAFWLSVAVRV